jgi:hypothetical protein
MPPIYDAIKNVAGSVKDAALRATLMQLKDKLLNKAIEKFGTINEIDYKDKKLTLTCELNGLEGNPIEVTIGMLKIADDGSHITVGDFDSNREFAKNALNMFAAKEYAVPENTIIRGGLTTLKKVLGL